MPGDYVPFDHDLPDKPEVLAIIQVTKVPIADVLFRLFRLWRLADGQTRDGRIENCGAYGIASRCGGDEAFWIAVSEVTPTAENPEGWLRFDNGCAVIPRFAERFRKCAKVRREEARERKRKWRERKKAEKNTGQSVGQGAGRPMIIPEFSVIVPRLSQGGNKQPEPEPEPETPTVSHLVHQGSGTGKSGRCFDFNGKWPDIKRLANETARTLWPSRRSLPKAEDQDSLMRSAALSVAVFSEDWLRTSADETAKSKDARNPIKYLEGILRRKAAEMNEDFDALKAAVVVPLKPTPAAKEETP
jgi:hypothetical protein